MPKLSAACVAVLVLLGASLAPAAHAADAPAAEAAQPLAARIDAAIAPYYKAGEPGAIVIVVKDGETVLRKGYGSADTAGKTPLSADMAMRLGSLTKQFTAVAILMLAEEGKLALTDDITRFLPDYPTRGKTITVEHLLTHTSGIVSFTSRPDYPLTMGRDVTVAQMIDSFKNAPLEFAPGTAYRYNNSGYFLLGAIIEKVSGQPYATFLEQRIFVPLGMENTAYEGFERGKATRAAGHTAGAQGFGRAAALSMSQPYAAGALVSTVDDLARWDAAIAAGKLLGPASWQRAFTSYTLADGKPTGYGYGWQVGKLQGEPVLAHSGAINGFATYALRLPAQRVFVAVLSNADSGMIDPGTVANQAATLAMGKPLPESGGVRIANAAFDTRVGRYELAPNVVLALSREGDRYFAQATGQAKLEIFARSETVFFAREIEAEVRFDGPDSSYLVLHQNGQRIKARRL
ncbi:serine hydrolase domain-containing protein [Massilia sp.]|uniref:serine hydrolase domain-containing protein n=1 Tax=Massilia sp. TaxID=1882437 RepID=UPI0028B0100C|nr:serine hydrolase domain-containing protein [Massilia sp.]